MTTDKLPKLSPEEYQAMRAEVLTRFKNIFEKVQNHPQFVCDQPGRRILDVLVTFKDAPPQDPQSGNVRLIQRMNEHMELIQEVEIGKSNTFRATLGQDEVYAEGVTQALDNKPFSNQPVTDLFVHFNLRRTDFFDALERAIESSDVKTTFEPAV